MIKRKEYYNDDYVEHKTLKEEIIDLKRQLNKDEKKEKNSFKIPYFARVSNKSRKKGFVTCLVVKENHDASFIKKQIVDGTVMIDDVPYVVTPEYVIFSKKKPIVIIPRWRSKPFSPEDNFDEATREKNTIYGYRLILNTMKNEIISSKKKNQMLWIIIGVIIAAGGAWYLFKGGF